MEVRTLMQEEACSPVTLSAGRPAASTQRPRHPGPAGRPHPLLPGPDTVGMAGLLLHCSKGKLISDFLLRLDAAWCTFTEVALVLAVLHL